MKAITYYEYGSPDVLQIEEMTKPVAEKKEVLIRVRAAEVTKTDCEMRSFGFSVKWFWLPLRLALGITKPRKPILGMYFSGEVVTLGEEVSQFKPGDLIFGVTGFNRGAYGEYMCLPESCAVVPKPENMNFEEAASVPLGGLNALHFMTRAKIKAGEKVLVNGAGGSIGIFAVQIAKNMGAEVTVVDKALKRDMLLSIGAERFIDYQQEDFTTSDGKYDVIFDMVPGSSYAGCVRSLVSGGRYVIGNPRFLDMLRSVFTTRLTDKTVQFAFAGETKEELLRLKKMIEDGSIGAVVDRVFPMHDVSEAHRLVETEQRIGSIVISMGQAPT
ncbi:NAD(P)-dependent alcohol dehydrogenase [Marinicella sp. W31]|uniref:NAD(P)-dependent alcohol dehydrogenase n=1 Tax=Marinicella sp. W31 TaxID=3023713 RepID=UPI0037563B13